MMKLGTQTLSALYLGGQNIKKAYLGESLVFSHAVGPDVCNITASIDPAGSGTVTGTGQYQKGAQVTVEAVPADGYQFTLWQEGGQTVSTAAEYTFTATGDRALTAVFAAKAASRLPDGYTEVEYIEANGGYISTEYVLNDTMKLIADIETLDYPVTRLETFFGATALSNNFRLALTAVDIKGSFGGSSSKTVDPDNSARKRTVGMDCKSRTMFVDESEVEFPIIAIPTNRYITLLSDTTNYTMHGRLYSCQMYTGSEETMIRDFVPCVDPSGAVGMYDLVEGKFCGNAGTGALTAGPAV